MCANVLPSSPTLVTLMMEAICSSKTSVLTRAIWHNIPKDGIFHSHHCENLKSYTANIVPNSMILFILMMEVMCSSETLVFTRVI
jgi:hypothetical protein